jgi:recombinase
MPEAKKISACPSWLALSEDRRSFVFLPERAEIVRKVFELAIGGMGSYAIANYLDERNIPTFGRSQSWDHTTIDNMLRSRATFGEYQARSYVGGSSRGLPVGPPVSSYYPAVIDQATFDAAQAARRQNLSSRRGRKGNNFANLFIGLATCAYCSKEVKYHSNGNTKTMVCSAELDENSGCTRTAWSYQDFEMKVLAFLAHPALRELVEGEQKVALEQLIDLIKELSEDIDQTRSTRLDMAVLLKKIVSKLNVASAGAEPRHRVAKALVQRDLPGRHFEIRLWDGPLYRCVSIG